MAGTFTESLSQSARDFKNLILPILKELWRDCDFLHTEANTDELSRALDCYSGIDVVRIDRNKQTVTGIASRIQRSKKCWETFTVRCERDNNTPTEYFKRICAMTSGDMIPALTYQAYVSPKGDKVIGMAIARTADILKFIVEGDTLTRHTDSTQFGQATFYVVRWRDMIRKNYELVHITPTQGGYRAQWRTGKKFIRTRLDDGDTPF